jgi:hypothetical protein
MSDVTVSTAELKQVADSQQQSAADEAGKGVQATANVDLKAELYKSHGPISGPSNEAISHMAHVREDAGRAIQAACLTLGAALHKAAAVYSGTDSGSAKDLDKEMPS